MMIKRFGNGNGHDDGFRPSETVQSGAFVCILPLITHGTLLGERSLRSPGEVDSFCMVTGNAPVYTSVYAVWWERTFVTSLSFNLLFAVNIQKYLTVLCNASAGSRARSQNDQIPFYAFADHHLDTLSRNFRVGFIQSNKTQIPLDKNL
jgi:hypothetical protein